MKNRKSFNSVRFEKGSGKNYVVKSVLSKGNADFFVEVYKMTILETKNLKKYYGKGDTQVKALDGVNLSVEDGEFVAIVGTSGSGKSTLLHMLGGLDRPTSGSVTVDGKNIFSLKDEALTIFRRRKIGFVFQSFNLVPVLTVRENIVLPIQLDGGKVDERYVGEVVTALGLEKKLNSLPGQLSGGQQQRVAGHSPGRRTDRKLGQPYQPRCTEPDEGDGPEIFPNDGHDYTQRRNCPTL